MGARVYIDNVSSLREEDAWDFFWSQARYASGMGVVWNTLTWVDEKGETLFDPSATGAGVGECSPLDGRSGVGGAIPMCPTAALQAFA